MEFSYMPKGPFNLLYQNQYFNGWPTLESDNTTIVTAFPVEGWQDSAAVTLHQNNDGTLMCKVYGTKTPEKAFQQALAAMSLDADGSGWPDISKKDKFVKELQEKYHYMRPTLFHSPYEAAAAFIAGHRITIKQVRAIRARLAQEEGQAIEVEGQTFYAFPSPQKLLEINAVKGLNEVKIERLPAAAQAAPDGLLDRAYLKSLSEQAALKKLQNLTGVGPFFAQGILY